MPRSIPPLRLPAAARRCYGPAPTLPALAPWPCQRTVPPSCPEVFSERMRRLTQWRVCLYLHELNYAYEFTPGAGEPFVMEIAYGSRRGLVCRGYSPTLSVLCSPVNFFVSPGNRQ
jgi:hypothetical protein